MLGDQIKSSFVHSAIDWVCDDYSVTIRFIAGVDGKNINIWQAQIVLSPLPFEVDNSFLIKSDQIFLGQIDITLATKQDLLQIIENAIQGFIETPNGKIVLPKDKNYYFHSEAGYRDRWFYELHLSIDGMNDRHLSGYELAEIDNLLRLSTPPFDGLDDAATWLGLDTNNYGGKILRSISELAHP